MTAPVTASVTASLLRGWPLPEPASFDKDSRGVVLVVGGTAGP